MKASEREKVYRRFPQGSYLALTRYPADDEDECRRLEATLNHHVKELEQAKWSQCLRYFTNIAYLMGNQYARFLYNADTNQLTYSDASAKVSMPGGLEQHIPKTVDNRLIGPYQSLISLLTEVRPKPRVTPESDSPEDTDAAQISELVIDLKWEAMRLPFRLRQAGSYLATMGTAIAETLWNEGIGTPEREAKTVTRRDAFSGEEYEERADDEEEDEEGPEPDVESRLWSPFHWQPDPGTTDDWGTMEWCYRQHYVDKGWVYENFVRDEEGYYLTEDDTIPDDVGVEYPIYWYERIKDIIETPEGWSQFSSRLGSVGSGFAPNQTIYRVWDCKPNPHFPKGRTLCQAGGKLIYAGPARAKTRRAPERWHPYAMTRYWTMPGRPWGVPLLSQLLPLQSKINAIDSLEQLAREMGTVGQWLVPVQSNVQDGVLTGLPGAVIQYTANATGRGPEKVQHQPLPAEYFAAREMASNQIAQIGGTESFLTTEAPSAVRSGSMIDLITRKERQQKSPTLQDFSEFVETIGKNTLLEVAIHMEEGDAEFAQRLRQAARDRSSAIAVVTFQAADLRDNFNVNVDIASELLKTPEAKQQRAEAALQYVGQELDPTARAKLFTVMGLDEFGVADTSDYRRAKRMVAVVSAGEVDAMQPMPWVDNPEVFAQVLKEEIQSDRFITYPEEAQAQLNTFYLTYQQMVQQQQMRMLEQQMLLQHGPPEPARSSGGGGSSGGSKKPSGSSEKKKAA